MQHTNWENTLRWFKGNMKHSSIREPVSPHAQQTEGVVCDEFQVM